MDFVKLIVVVLLCRNCESLIPDEYIVDAQEGDVPYIAQINVLYPHTGDFLPFCAGAIISDRHILTAAMCATPCNFSSNCRVFVGRTKVNSGGVEIGIRKSEWHPSYYEMELLKTPQIFMYNFIDIGILFTSERIEFSFSIQPIALPTQNIDEEDTPIFVAGWGNIDYTVSDLNLFHSQISIIHHLIFIIIN